MGSQRSPRHWLISQIRPSRPKQLNPASGYSQWLRQCCFPRDVHPAINHCSLHPFPGERDIGQELPTSLFYSLPIVTITFQTLSMVSQGQDITLKDWLCHSWHSSFSTQSLLLQQELSHSFFVLWQISDNTSGHFDSEHVTSPKGPIFSQVKIWQTPTFAISPVWHTIVLTHSPWYMNTELHARFSHSLWVSICISRRLCCCHLFYFWFKFSSLDFNVFEDLFLLLLRDF